MQILHTHLRALILGAVILVSPKAVAEDGQVSIMVTPFTGGTGQTMQNWVVKTLEQTGDFVFLSKGGSYRLSGESTGGTLHGVLTDAEGKVLLKQDYAALTLKDNARQLADECIGTIFGWPGTALTKIAFVSEATGRKEIYLCDSDGSDVQQLTKDDSSCVSPSLRVDGQAMLFTSYVTGYPDVYMMDLDSGLRKRILQAPGTNTGAVFSPQGDSLALTMSFTGNSELYLVTPEGKGGRRLTRTEAAECSPTWSPEGDRLLYCTTLNGLPVLEIRSMTSSATQVLNTGYAYNTEPDWAPTGNKIAFTVKHEKKLQVAVMDFETKKVTLIGPGQYPAWGADGRHLLYVKGNELVMRNTVMGKERTIISQMAKLSEPTWSR